jgi:acetyl-CoA carboxylase carboxyl transferase subunit beta
MLWFRGGATDISETPTTEQAERKRAAPPLCPRCRAVLVGARSYARFRVCDTCGHHDRRSARETIQHLTDAGSFREMDAQLGSTDPLAFTDDLSYRDRLGQQRQRTGEIDAIVTGTATLAGNPIVIAALDFSFMGGSMGVVVGEKLVRACDRARHDRRPLIVVAASGGARMQEGMLSLLQMAKTATAVTQLREAGVPYLSILTNPTTGGVFASFANLGDVIVAEPESLIGFAGPRVAEQAMGQKLPPGSHTAEFLLRHGMIDAIVDRRRLRRYLSTLLEIFAARGEWRPDNQPAARLAAATVESGAWDTVQAARHPGRPTSLAYIERMVESFVELHGDRQSGDDPAVIIGIGILAGRAVAIIAQERGGPADAVDRHGGRAYPEGYRKARRLMALAARLKLPLVSLIDTPGAYPGVEAEERGLASELAASMATMAELPVPIVAAVIGEGGSGGALALAIADRVLMQRGAIYSVISPEAAATILYRDPARAEELSAQLKLTATDLHTLKIIDHIVAEPAAGPGADLDAAAILLKRAIVSELGRILRTPADRLVNARIQRYRAIGRAFARNTPYRSAPPERGTHAVR